MNDFRKIRLDSTLSRRVTAVELVHDVLRNAILRGELTGGSRLVQTEIASELGMSTTPVREAMRELATDGLITLDSHRIGIVRTPDWDEMSEIVAMRQALEPVATERAMANITDQQLDRANRLAEELAHDELDLGSWVQRNIAFHNVFHEATASVRIAPVMLSLDSAAGVFAAQAQRVNPQIREQAVNDHFSLIDAYRARDLDRAIEIEREHVMLPLRAASLDDELK